MKESEKESQNNFNPVDAIREACEECGIDWKGMEFDEKDMLQKF